MITNFSTIKTNINQMNINQIKDKLNYLIVITNNGIRVSETSIDDEDKGYPYACGYTRSTLQQIKKELQEIVDCIMYDSNVS